MELTFDKSTHIGLGYAKHADAFQCGREAAQMAKSQLTKEETDLVFAFCPSGVHFKDFIEGVRLVTGEEKLVGIPVDWALSNDLPSANACIVLMAQCPSVYTTITSGPETLPKIAALTSILTQFRQSRGSAHHMFEHHGLLFIENSGENAPENALKHIMTNLDLETWIAHFVPSGATGNPIVCQNKILRNGFAAIEFFSNAPIGIGNVPLDSFINQSDIIKEAAASAIRDALAQMDPKNVAVGLIFINAPTTPLSQDERWSIFRSATAALPKTPLVLIPTQFQFSRHPQRSVGLQHGAMTALLVPK